jgi:hypothetical protein
MARPKGSTLSESHKAALSEGRRLSNAVSNYLEALEANKPKRGRKRTKESITQRIPAIEGELAAAGPLARLQLIQEKMDLEGELAALGAKTDLQSLEAEFVKAAPRYSQSKGISYAAWRALGVSPEVLKKAGITS